MCYKTWQSSFVISPIPQMTSDRQVRDLHSYAEISFWDVSYYYRIFMEDRGEFKWGRESCHSREATQQYDTIIGSCKVSISQCVFQQNNPSKKMNFQRWKKRQYTA